MKLFYLDTDERERGLTLVEVLAILIILSIICITLFSVLSNSQSQNDKQSEKNTNLTEISYALKILTKEIRKNPNYITINNNTLYIGDSNSKNPESYYQYKLENNSITKKDLVTNKEIVLINNVESFTISTVVPPKDSLEAEHILITINETSTKIVERRGKFNDED